MEGGAKVFAPTLRPAVIASEARQVHVVACEATGQMLLPACDAPDNFPRVNHWVVGQPLDARLHAPPVGRLPWADSATVACDRPAATSLRALCLLAGFAILETRMDGECGIHCMNLFQAGREENGPSSERDTG